MHNLHTLFGDGFVLPIFCKNFETSMFILFPKSVMLQINLKLTLWVAKARAAVSHRKETPLRQRKGSVITGIFQQSAV